jgi:DNA-binding FadR family transcriptional regulator
MPKRATKTKVADRLPPVDEQPIRRRKLYEEVVERIEAGILNGRYGPGDQLPSERILMETYRVGRTSIREALFALQRMGLVSIVSGERARVTQPTPASLVTDLSGVARHLLASNEGVRHFQQARMLFEISLARHAAEYATADDIALMRMALEANRAAIGKAVQFAQTDVAFHFLLAQIPKNPIFTSLHMALVEWLTEQRSTSSRQRGSNEAAYHAHASILGAIERRDVEGAGNAMRRHLEEVNSFYWAVRRNEEA